MYALTQNTLKITVGLVCVSVCVWCVRVGVRVVYAVSVCVSMCVLCVCVGVRVGVCGVAR